MSTNVAHTRALPSCRTLLILKPGDAGYPPCVREWPAWRDPGGLFSSGDDAPGPVLAAVGQAGILARPSLGLLCSVRCPGNLVLLTYDFAKKTPHDGPSIIGGFHSPMERTCLDTLLARHVPVVYCPGRRLNERGIPRAWDPALAEGRLLVVSPFPDSQRHVTRYLALQRNQFVALLADALFVPFAMRGGSTEGVVRLSLHRGKTVYTLADRENGHLLSLGARGVTPGELLEQACNETAHREVGRRNCNT